MSADITADQAYADRLAKASPLAAAALQLGQTVELADAQQPAKRQPAVHYFDTATEARDALSSDQEMELRDIRDGDILIVVSQKTVAIVVGCIPAAITEKTGALSPLPSCAYTYAGGAWAASAKLAEEIARGRNFPMNPLHANPNPAPAAQHEMPKLSKYGPAGWVFTRHDNSYLASRHGKAGAWIVTKLYGRQEGRDGEVLGRDPKTRKAAILQAIALIDERQAAKQKPQPEPEQPKQLTAQDAWRIVSQTWPNATDFQPYHVTGGRFCGYTFRAGHLHSARYGWITATNRYSRGLEAYRSTAAEVLLHADRDDQEAAAPPAKPARPPFEPGDRVKCVDGWYRTVKSLSTGMDSKQWLRMNDGGAWPASKCERVDASAIDEVRTTLHHAGVRVRAENDRTSDRTRDALAVIGECLRYLHRADPDGLVGILAASTERVTVEIPRTGVVASDILHQHGARFDVLESGLSDTQGTGDTKWWAEILGVTEEDRRATYSCAWTTSLPLEYCMRDKVTVERIIPGRLDLTPEQSRDMDTRTVTALRAGDLVEAVISGSQPRTIRVRLDRKPWPGGPGRLVLSNGKSVDMVLSDSIRIIDPAVAVEARKRNIDQMLLDDGIALSLTDGCGPCGLEADQMCADCKLCNCYTHNRCTRPAQGN